MSESCNHLCQKILSEIRDLLRNMDRKMAHIIEQNRIERQIFFWNRGGNAFGGDEDD